MRHFFRKVATILAFAAVSLSLTASITDLPVKTINGKQYYYYTVQAKETVYSLCKRLNITKEAMLESNPSVADGLKAGQTLVFPVESAGASRHATTTYMVQKDETGYGISRKFGMTTDEFYQLNPNARDGLKAGQYVTVCSKPTDSPSSASKETEGIAGSGDKYTIAPGETLYSIAQRHGVTLRDLLAANPSVNPESYEAGQEIVIPKDPSNHSSAESIISIVKPTDGNRYEVKEGDTFYGIAHSHGLSVEQLKGANPSIDILKAGMVIEIPQGCDEINGGYGMTEPGPVAVVASADTMTIAVVMPFSSGDSRGSQAVEFIRGFMLAVDSLRSEGSPVRVTILDNPGTESEVKALLKRPALRNANVIVAPNAVGQLELFSRFAKDNKVYLLNLFGIKDQSYKTNPYMMNGNISHEDMYEKAINYYLSRYSDVVPVFIKRKDGKEDKSEYVVQFKEKLKENGSKYHEIEYVDKLSEITLNKLPEGNSYAFIPNTSNVAELQTFIDAINSFRDSHPEQVAGATLWGYPEWLKIRGENLRKLHNVNTLIFSRFFSVEKNDDEEILQNKFEKWYGTRIVDKAPKSGTLGFDTGMFLLKALSANGGDFTKFTPAYDGLQNGYNFVRVPDGGWINNELFMINFAPGEFIMKHGI